ncbi:MAG TPA: hypothetical protein VNJ02_04975 [Vicinamibacterales bacterium]|nr:hypothetical protein [Vicinamibacterales bacterium]
MRVLFHARHFGYLRNFESVIAALAERGHTVHLAADRPETAGGEAMVERLAARFATNVSWGWTPSRDNDRWSPLVMRVRLALDNLRYWDRSYDQAPRLRARANERTPRAVLAALRTPAFAGPTGRAWLARGLRRLERAAPIDHRFVQFLRDQRPDALVVTPLVDLGSPQAETVRAARTVGVRTALGVGSWDHLSSKALVREHPDRVFVWNETQKREAVTMHGLDSARVVVTGAQCYDHWFDRTPSRSHRDFCAAVGLPAGEKFILYVCSSLFKGSPPEPVFVRHWLESVRQHPQLRETPVLIRPHPSRMQEWDGVDVSAFARVAFAGGYPIDAASRADYFDALYHSSAVVGLNTSAFIEAGIAGRPVLAQLHPDFRDNQSGTLHFRYLVDGGLLDVADTSDEHLTQLHTALTSDPSAPRRERFIRDFVRPYGLEVRATDRFVEALESWVSEPAPAPRTVQTRGPARLALAGLRVAAQTARGQQWMLDEREAAKRAARPSAPAKALSAKHR